MMTNSSTVKTGRDRLGRPADFPLHAPTDVERAMEAEIAGLRIAAERATVSIPAAWREFARAVANLPIGAEPNLTGMRAKAQQLLDGGVQADATAEMLDMLGRIEPLAMHDKNDRDQWYERLCRARAVQQPLPVPDQAAVVWRSDLVRAVAELIQLRAVHEFNMKAPAVRPTDDHLWDATLRDRDTYQEWADKLAAAIAKHFAAEIGEHSNMNCPWAEALEVIEGATRGTDSQHDANAVVSEAFLKGAHAEFSEAMPPDSLTSLGHRHVVNALRAAIKFYIQVARSATSASTSTDGGAA